MWRHWMATVTYQCWRHHTTIDKMWTAVTSSDVTSPDITSWCHFRCQKWWIWLTPYAANDNSRRHEMTAFAPSYYLDCCNAIVRWRSDRVTVRFRVFSRVCCWNMQSLVRKEEIKWKKLTFLCRLTCNNHNAPDCIFSICFTFGVFIPERTVFCWKGTTALVRASFNTVMLKFRQQCGVIHWVKWFS